MTDFSAESTGVPRKRRRVERPSDAEDIDRSWDSPDAASVFLEPGDPKDPRLSDDVDVILDETPGAVDSGSAESESDELDEQFWDDQKPPHYSG